MSLCGHEFRLILAVYHYTIGFNKLKDDMNGKRLEQITKIRYDHSNKTIVGLARKNIIVTNKGRYGKWMSINVEFDHWHEEYQGLNNIDPTHLLSDECRNKPIDGGDTGLIADHLKPLDNPPVNSPSKPKIETKPTPKRAETSESLNTLEYLEQRGKKLTESITKSVLDVVSKQYPKATHPAKTTATTVRETTEDPVKPSTPKTSGVEASETVPVAQRNNSMMALSDLIEPPAEPPFLIAETLDYPHPISQRLRLEMAPHLNNLEPKFYDKAQGLVYYFAECLATSKVRRPMGFFISIKERVTGGSLTLSEGDTRSPQDKQAEEERREREYERQLAITDYHVMEKRIMAYAEREQCTFSECLEKRELVGLWQGILNKLDTFNDMPDDPIAGVV